MAKLRLSPEQDPIPVNFLLKMQSDDSFFEPGRLYLFIRRFIGDRFCMRDKLHQDLVDYYFSPSFVGGFLSILERQGLLDKDWETVSWTLVDLASPTLDKPFTGRKITIPDGALFAPDILEYAFDFPPSTWEVKVMEDADDWYDEEDDLRINA